MFILLIRWADGYNYRFGLHYVNYTSPNLTRYPKASAFWYADYIKKHAFYTKSDDGTLVGSSSVLFEDNSNSIININPVTTVDDDGNDEVQKNDDIPDDDSKLIKSINGETGRIYSKLDYESNESRSSRSYLTYYVPKSWAQWMVSIVDFWRRAQLLPYHIGMMV